MAASISNIPVRAFPALAIERLAIGFGQGVVLWLLYRAAQRHSWPATQLYLFAPLLLVVMFVPILALAGLGALRRWTLVSWLACAVLVLVVAGLHEVARSQAPAMAIAALDPIAGGVIIRALALALFIAHALVTAADADRWLAAAYPTYFEIAWKHEVQLLLSLLFLELFWGVLWLGAELFRLIDIDDLRALIVRAAFAIPASALAFAFAVHVTDARVALVQGCGTCFMSCFPGCCRWRCC